MSIQDTFYATSYARAQATPVTPSWTDEGGSYDGGSGDEDENGDEDEDEEEEDEEEDDDE